MHPKIFPSDIIQWNHPISIVLSGPSNSGKSTICFNLIRYRHAMLKSKRPLKVYYHLPARHKILAPADILNDPYVSFHENIPDFDAINEPCIVVLDDLAEEINNDVVEAFTRFSHHKEITILLVTHNIFHSKGNNFFRTISLNTGVFFLTKNPRNSQQIGVLASQINPSKRKTIINSYLDAISRPYGYLCIDCTQNCNESFRFRTNIFPSDPEPRNVIYSV